jgi:hypothetical protein
LAPHGCRTWACIQNTVAVKDQLVVSILKPSNDASATRMESFEPNVISACQTLLLDYLA